jgi:hypothetical protein
MFQHPPAPIRLFPSLLHRQPTTDQRQQSVRLFHWGFFCLPILWLLNWILYRKVVDMADAPTEMKAAVRWSIIGFGVAMAVLLVSRRCPSHAALLLHLHRSPSS